MSGKAGEISCSTQTLALFLTNIVWLAMPENRKYIRSRYIYRGRASNGDGSDECLDGQTVATPSGGCGVKKKKKKKKKN